MSRKLPPVASAEVQNGGPADYTRLANTSGHTVPRELMQLSIANQAFPAIDDEDTKCRTIGLLTSPRDSNCNYPQISRPKSLAPAASALVAAPITG